MIQPERTTPDHEGYRRSVLSHTLVTYFPAPILHTRTLTKLRYIVRLRGYQIVHPVLQTLLSKAPEDKHEKALGKSSIRPVVSGLAFGVFLIDDPAISPCYNVPEQYPPCAKDDALLDGIAFIVKKSTHEL